MSAPGETAPTPATDDWAAWQDALLDAVLRLRDGESLTLTADAEHERTPRAAGGRLRVLLPQRARPLAPTLRLVRVEDHLRGHWSGSRECGGDFPWEEAEVEQIVRLGWHRPGQGDGTDFVRFWPDDVPQGPYLPYEDALRAAEAATSTFRTLLGDPVPGQGWVSGP